MVISRIDPNCLLNLEEAQALRNELLSEVLDSIKQVREIEAGYTLKFDSGISDLIVLADWVQVERLCSPFLKFRLSIESHEGPVWLDLMGPSGTQDFLKKELVLGRWL